MTNAAPAIRPPQWGEPARIFSAPTDTNPNYAFGTLGGHWVVLAILGSLSFAPSLEAMRQVMARRALFDDDEAAFFGVTTDPDDPKLRGMKASLPGLRYFWDFDQKISRLYGVADGERLRPMVFLVDPGQRIVAAEPIARMDAVLDKLEQYLRDEPATALGGFAPVLTLPRIFEPELCQELIAYYRRIGGQRSGFMREVNGKTVGVHDSNHKRRLDVMIEDDVLRNATTARLERRLVPMIEMAFAWKATRIERYVVSCYAADEKGFFRPHRDNTTPGTAHRKFAVTLNLNAEDYEGGELRFPEFGRRTYKPPTGGATVFNCSLLHEATPVTSGVRFAFLPFLYDEAGKAVREANAGSFVNSPIGDAPEDKSTPEPSNAKEATETAQA